MKRGRTVRSAYSIVGCVLAIGFLARPAGAGELRRVNYALSLPTISHIVANQTIPRYLGYYAEEGLDVNIVSTGAGGVTAAAQLVATGQHEIGSSTQSPILTRAAEGQDMGLAFFYNHIRDFHYVIGVLPESDLTDVRQLKGKNIGVISLASEGVVAARYMARQAGLDAEKDLTFVAVGVGAQAIHALRTGRVDAISNLPGAFAQMEVLGQRARFLPVPSGTEKVFGPGLFARRDFLQANRKVVVGIGRAVAKGTLFMLTNPEAAVRIHWRLYPEQVPKGVPAEKALQDAVHAVRVQSDGLRFRADEQVRLWGHYPPEGWDAYLRIYGFRDKVRDATRYYTNDLVQEINAFDPEKVVQRARTFRFD